MSPHNINKGIMLSCFRDMIFPGKTIFLRKNHIPQPSFLLCRYCAVESQIGHPRISADPCFILFSPFSPFAYRKCNCDAAELQWRRDGGIINSTSKLPVKTLNFMDSQREEAQGIITLGKLYCAQVDFGMIWRTFSTMNIHVCTLIFKWRKIWFKYH